MLNKNFPLLKKQQGNKTGVVIETCEKIRALNENAVHEVSTSTCLFCTKFECANSIQ